MTNLVLAGLLLGHGLIHASYLARPRPLAAGGPAWPFELDGSRLLRTVGLRGTPPRILGILLVATTVGAFGLAGLSTAGLVPATAWQVGVAVGALASLATLLIYFHPWLTLGVLIDLVLLYAVLVAGWAPEGLRA